MSEQKTEKPEAKTAGPASFQTGTWKCSCGVTNQLTDWRCFVCFRSVQNALMKNAREVAKAAKAEAKAKQATADATDQPKTAETKTAEKPERKMRLMDGLPETMKALVKDKEAPGFTLHTDLPVPRPAEDEVLVRSYANSLCGSDIVLYDWSDAAKVIASVPFTPGHECAGLVVGVGANVRRPRLGDRVTIENHFWCDDCATCRIGRRDICMDFDQFGHGKGTQYGGLGQFFTCPSKYCYVLKAPSLSMIEASALEPLGIAVNACRNADLESPEQVLMPKGKRKPLKQTLLVVGCGSIGNLVIGVARTMPGVGRIIGCDISPKKLELAKTMGADAVFNVQQLAAGQSFGDKVRELTGGVGADRAIECSGVASMVNLICSSVRKGAKITLVGMYKQAVTIENPLTNVMLRSLQIRSISGRRVFESWAAAEALAATGKVDIKKVISHTFKLEQFDQAMTTLKSGEGVKVVIDML